MIIVWHFSQNHLITFIIIIIIIIIINIIIIIFVVTDRDDGYLWVHSLSEHLYQVNYKRFPTGWWVLKLWFKFWHFYDLRLSQNDTF